MVVAARRLNLLEEVVAEIEAAGSTAMACACDITDESRSGNWWRIPSPPMASWISW